MSTLWKTIYVDAVLWTSLSVIQPKLRSPTRSRTSSWPTTSSDWQSEPYHQNQHCAEWRYRTIKAWTNTIMNKTGAPVHCWLLTLQYVCYILNHISTASLGGQLPLQVLYGVTPDISIIFLYTFYQPIFYATHDQHFPSDSEERAGFWVGFAESLW